MSDPEGSQELGWCEILIVGPIGAVLRRALEPCGTGPGQLQTIVRARTCGDVDFVSVAEHLFAQGAPVLEIIELADRPARSRR